MQFLIVSDTSEINGGAAKVSIDTARGLANSGEKVIFFAGGGSIDEKLSHPNIEVINLGLDNLLSGNRIKMFFVGYYNRKAKKAFEQLLNRIDLENTIVHIHSWVKTLTASIFESLSKRKKLFYITAHDYFLVCPNGGLFIYPRQTICPDKKNAKCLFCNCDSRNYIFKIWRYFKFKKQQRILKKCDYKLITLSNLMKEVFARNHFDSQIVKNPVEMNNDCLMTQTGKPNSFVYIGRLSKEKGVELMCEAFAKTNKQLAVFGDGPIKEELVLKYNNCSNISFLGWKSKKDINSYLPNCLALVFPSMWYEGAPLTIPEVQSFGVPAIVSNACSGVDYIIEGKNGFVFESNNIDDLINKIEIMSDMSFSNYSLLRKETARIALKENSNIPTYIKFLKGAFNEEKA